MVKNRFKVGDKIQLSHVFDRNNPTKDEEWLNVEKIEYQVIYTVKRCHSSLNDFILVSPTVRNYWLDCNHFEKVYVVTYCFNVEDF